MARPLLICTGLIGLALAGCSSPPDFADNLSADTPFPQIVPTSQITAQVPAETASENTDALASRAAALRARAATLRGQAVVAPDDKAELNAADPQVPAE